ncbi:MAG: SOUL family heme-binding protein [Chitinophagaceae bacterium]
MMKSFLLIFLVVGILFLFLQSFVARSTRKIEHQAYKVVFQQGQVEIRYYPSVMMATYTSTARGYRALANTGFRKVAGYIFGANRAHQKISMTAPVHMEMREKGSSMSFVMPSQYTAEKLPEPNDPEVKLKEEPAQYMAALRFSGFVSEKKLLKYKTLLEEQLQQMGVPPTGPFRYLGYNPPYQLVGRRNEVLFPVSWKE